MSALERFQDWYLAQCDGKWEGDRGITVGTLDGPGWRVSVDLTGTYLENAGFEEFVVERLEDDWAHARVVEFTVMPGDWCGSWSAAPRRGSCGAGLL